MEKRIIYPLVFFLAIALLIVPLYKESRWEEQEEEFEKEREDGADKQLSSWWWGRAFPDPTGFNQKYYTAWLHAKAMKNPEAHMQTAGARNNNSTTLFNGNWNSIGPDQNIGGRILSVAIDPSNSNRIFIGSASGGIWRTSTGGVGANAWQPVNTGFPVLGVASIIIDPSNPNIIYAGTGEVYRVDTSNIGFNVWKARGTYGIGILKSSDGGNTWTQVFNRNMPDLFGIQMLVFDPGNRAIIYACTTDGLYRTNNSGASWTKILDKIYVSDIVINATNTNEMVVAVGNLLNSDKGIYRTINGGASWTKITSGLPASFDGFIRLDNIASDPDMIIASIGRDDGGLNELYRSTNFGANWSVLSNSNHCQYQFWFSHDVAINPSNTNELVMGGVPLYNYTISSASRSSIGGVHADIHDIEFDPSNSNVVYVACDGGMYRSTNGGNSFSMINGGLHAVQFYASFAVSPANPNIMLGGLQDNGVVRYNGSSWSQVAGGDGGPCAFHPSNGNIAFASNDARRLLRSTNGGSSFSEVLTSWAFVADSRTGFMAPIGISNSNPSVMYAASDNLHSSGSGGTSGSWTGNNYSTATNYVEARHKTGIAMAISETNANKLYVSTSPFAQYDNNVNDLYINTPPNLLRSMDGGANFTSIKGSLPDRFIMDIAINPNDDDSAWIVLGGFGSSHLYVTGNGGSSWVSRGSGLPDVPHNAVLLDPNNSNIIYVGNDIGVYMSPDKGLTWHDFNNGFWDATLVMDLVAAGSSQLVAATHGKGVFISDLYSVQLPLTLLSFTGQWQRSQAELKWVTSFEENVSNFEVERSFDGINFSRIATIAAQNSATGATYAYNDNSNGLADKAVLFYRLKMNDIDAQFTYSSVVTIRLSNSFDLNINGNPFKSQLSISITSSNRKIVQLNMYDAAGKKLAFRNVNTESGTNTYVLNDFVRQPAGVYFIEAIIPGRKIIRRLVKQ